MASDILLVLAGGLAGYYLLPLISVLLGFEFARTLTALCFAFIHPVYNYLTGLLFTSRHGFHGFLPLLTVGLFLPSVFLFHQTGAVLYGGAYGAACLLGCGAGTVFRNYSQSS